MILKTFGWSLALTVVGLVAALVYGGWDGAAIAAILIVLEISFSFDNAVVNAKVLGRMSEGWRRIFITIGVLIAVVGMRLLFPLVVVCVAASLSPVRVVTLAMEKGDVHTPGTYGYLLSQAHPTIAAFGGTFLLMIFLAFVFEEKDVHWLAWLERPLERVGRIEALEVVIAISVVVVAARTLGSDHSQSVLTSGLAGLVVYLVVNGVGEAFASDDEIDEVESAAAGRDIALATGKAGLMLFLYLEVLDASFSFDGVIGAFAITADPIIIAIGLGVGAIYVRSLTVHLVRQGTLAQYVYLEHGAHWAIGALAVLLMVSIGHEIPELVTGLLGIGFIGAAFAASVRRNRVDDKVSSAGEELVSR